MQEDYNKTCQWIKDNKKVFLNVIQNKKPIIIDSITIQKKHVFLTTFLEQYFKDMQLCMS